MTGAFPAGFDSARGHWNEIGMLARDSARMLNEISHTQIAGAENLLTKALRAFAAGDGERAEQLIERAARIPYDPREQGSPGVRAASMLVDGLITEQFEASEYDDLAWLDVVLQVHSGLDQTGQAEVASVVHGLVLQKDFFSVSAAEKRRIRQFFGHAPLEAERGDVPNATVEQRQDIIRSLTVAAKALDDAFAAAER